MSAASASVTFKLEDLDLLPAEEGDLDNLATAKLPPLHELKVPSLPSVKCLKWSSARRRGQ